MFAHFETEKVEKLKNARNEVYVSHIVSDDAAL